MTISERTVHAPSRRGGPDWRRATGRILANAVLTLLAFEVVSFVVALAGIVGGMSGPMTPEALLPALGAFLLVRWVFVLPGLLAVLAAIDYTARCVPHAPRAGSSGSSRPQI